MWERAEELACVYDFGKLGRVKGLSEKLFEKKLASSALGDNTYYILPMKGRVQIDLLKAVQNNPSFKMDSYKLDNVASTFMRGPLKETKLLDSEQPGTRIVTSSTEGLKEGGWVTLVKNNGIIEEPYADTGKLQIHGVTPTSFEVATELELEPGMKHSWCESKDDVTAADIFRLQKGTSTDRALVAKYCVQDCELVGRLFDKLSMLPNNLAMGNVCNVPFGYLFLRGQGVKIFSLVSKQCRQDGYIMPVMRPPPDAPPEADSSSTGDDVEQVVEKYEGAIVLDPIPDVHYDPVAVSDFNSLCKLKNHVCVWLDVCMLCQPYLIILFEGRRPC